MRPLLPAALLALFTWWSGTFTAGAEAVPVAVGTGALLVFVAATGVGADPLRLGRRRWILLALLVVATGASWALAEVSRAGRSAVLLLPAFLALPGAVARCLPRERELGRGAEAVALVAGITGIWGLVDRAVGEAERAAAPLGHHLLLGEWLVLFLPLAWWAASRKRGRARLRKAVGWSAVGAVIAAIVATGSIACLAALAVQLVVLARRRSSRISAAVAVGIAVAAIPVLGVLDGVVERITSSWQARLTYWEAGVRGWLERPFLGHGPGSTGWTIGEHHLPVPGVNPPGELVSDLHSVPLGILYETGAVGAVLVGLVGVFLVLGIRGGIAGRDDGLGDAATAIGLGAATALTVGVTLGTSAVWAGAGIVLGFVLSPAAASTEPASARVPPPARRGRLGWTIYAVAASLALAPLFLARWHYERALEAESIGEVERRVALAIEADPSFPLYRLRSALYARSPRAAAIAADRATELAPGVAAFWLVAGDRAASVGLSGADELLGRACLLDPLAATAPMLLALDEADGPITFDETAARDGAGASRARSAARALLAEPGLVASPHFDRVSVRRRVAAAIESWPGVDAGWRRAMVERLRVPPLDAPADDEYVATIDDPRGGASESFSLVLFRRPPWPGALTAVPVRGEVFEAVALPAATRLPSTEPAALLGPDRGCSASGERREESG